MRVVNAAIGAIVGCIVAVAALTPAHATASTDDAIDLSGMHVEEGVQYVAIGCGSYGAKSVRIGNVITTAKVKGQSIGTTGTSLVFY